MKKITKFCFALLLGTIISSSAYAETESNVTRDFTFGIEKNASVTPISDDAGGQETFVRFLEMKNELPDEIPLFEPYDVNSKHQIFVAPNGNDGNSGTIDKPLKTLEQAFLTAASHPYKSEGLTIFLREGIYDVSKGLTIPEELSGSDKHPVIISNYNDESVSLTGGISFKGSQMKIADDATAMRRLPESSKGKVYSINLYDMGYSDLPQIEQTTTPVLTVDGSKYTLARWPNSETTSPAKYEGEDNEDGFYKRGTVSQNVSPYYTGERGVGFEFMMRSTRPLSWENDGNIWMNGSFDRDWIVRNYRIKEMNAENKSITSGHDTEYGGNYHINRHYYYFNVMEELDIPGEWYIDYNTGTLYLYPIYDITNSSVDIALSSKTLVTFAKGTHNIVLNGIEVKGGNSIGIVIAGYRNVVQRCTVKDVSGSNVRFDRSKNCGLICSNIYGGVSITYHQNWDKKNQDEVDLTPTCNFVQNNYVIGGSISMRYGVQNIISHNSVINVSGMCIYVAQQMESIVEYNEVTGGPHQAFDAGMIYVEGFPTNRGNHVRYNYLHDAQIDPHAETHGIYFDDTVSGDFAYGNILEEADFHSHNGSDHVVYENVIIDKKNNVAISNSLNYYKGGMQDTFIQGQMKTNPNNMAMQTQGQYKIAGGKWTQRYPALEQWYYWILELREEYKKDPKGYINTDIYKKTNAPKRCVYKNNIIFNSDTPTYSLEKNGEYKPWWHQNIEVPLEDKDIFVDYDNKNFNIKENAYVYEQMPDYDHIPSQERRGVIIADNLTKEKLALTKLYQCYPVVNSENRILPYDIAFSWTDIPGTAYYKLKIARDEAMTDIVGEYTTKYNYYTFEDDLDVGSKYYWQVEAVVEAQSMDMTSSFTDVSYFYTYTYEEAAAVAELNVDAYKLKVEEIKSYTDGMYEDDGTDHGIQPFKPGTKDKVYQLLKASQKRVDGYALQKEIENEIESLYKSFINILMENRVDYTRTISADDLSMWNVNTEKGAVTTENGIISVKAFSETGAVTATDQRMLAPGEKVKIRVKFPLKEFEGIGIKQIPSEVSGGFFNTEGYYIVVTSENIEIQRYPVKDVPHIIAAVPNDGIMRPNEWHDVEFSCTPEGDGQRLVVIVDGKEILNYFDDVAPNHSMGYLSIQGRNAETQLMGE